MNKQIKCQQCGKWYLTGKVVLGSLTALSNLLFPLCTSCAKERPTSQIVTIKCKEVKNETSG